MLFPRWKRYQTWFSRRNHPQTRFLKRKHPRKILEESDKESDNQVNVEEGYYYCGECYIVVTNKKKFILINPINIIQFYIKSYYKNVYYKKNFSLFWKIDTECYENLKIYFARPNNDFFMFFAFWYIITLAYYFILYIRLCL